MLHFYKLTIYRRWTKYKCMRRQIQMGDSHRNTNSSLQFVLGTSKIDTIFYFSLRKNILKFILKTTQEI